MYQLDTGSGCLTNEALLICYADELLTIYPIALGYYKRMSSHKGETASKSQLS